jgi:hypothetical protein
LTALATQNGSSNTVYAEKGGNDSNIVDACAEHQFDNILPLKSGNCKIT